MKLAYRPDIDGLRAIAVLAVLFFHTEVPGFGGGFVGVDIFFVISGFLITSILLNDIKEDNFSIARFYERRIRRIFPALFPVIIFSLIIGVFLLDSNAFKDFGESITATALFSSNILFWSQSGYFDTHSMQKPLLHTWSLAVEEQFYIIFPIALFFVNRFLKCRNLQFLLITALLSFFASIYWVNKEPSATFYLVHTRAWELLVGSILAINILPKPSSYLQSNLLSILGIGFIFYSVLFYTEKTLFPGINAALPVLGAALIIHSGDENNISIVSKFLKFKPLVFIGLISYSLYLWHWVFIAYYKYFLFRPFNEGEKFVIIVFSLFVATFSWRYIESPFRGTALVVIGRKKIFIYSASIVVIISGIGLVIYTQDGMPVRYPKANRVVSQAKWEWYPNSVFGNLESLSNNVSPGRFGRPGTKPSFILWGDSYAMALLPGLDEKARQYGLSGFVATHSSCPPLLGIDDKANQYNDIEFNNNVLLFIKNHPEIKTVILSGAWPGYPDDELHGVFDQKKSIRCYNLLEIGLKTTVEKLLVMNRKVVLVADVPWLEIGDISRYLYMSIRFPMYYNDLSDVAPTRHEYNKLNHSVLDIMKRMANSNKVALIHPEEKLYHNGDKCIFIVDGLPLYRDEGHLSTFGSHFVSTIFDDILKQMSWN